MGQENSPAARFSISRHLKKTVWVSLLAMLAIAGPALLNSAAVAQDYPNRPLTLIVPFAAGASTDVIARAAALELGQRLGKSIVVENKPGAGTIVGAVAARNAKPDGYTILIAPNSFYAAPLAMKNPGFDPIADFIPLVGLASAAYVLISPTTIPSKSLKDLLAHAKANPGTTNYGSLGRGTPLMLLPERVKAVTGIDWREITYKGGTEGMLAVMRGEVHGYFASVSLAAQYVDQPKLNLVAITSTRRTAYLPNVPTFAESGYPQIVDEAFYGLLALAKTPTAIVARLRKELIEVRKSPAFIASLKKNSLEQYDGTIDEYNANVDKMTARFTRELQQLGIKPE